MRQGSQVKRVLLNDHINIKMIARGILVSYLITIPIFIIFAFALTFTDFPEKLVPSMVLTATIISVLVAGTSVTRTMRSKGWLNGGIVGLIYMLVLYLFSSVTFSDFSINRYMVTVMLIGILTGAIGGIVGINFRRSK